MINMLIISIERGIYYLQEYSSSNPGLKIVMDHQPTYMLSYEISVDVSL